MTYERQAKNAVKKIKQKGRTVVYRSYTEAAPVDGKPWKPTEATTKDYTVAVLFLPQTGPNRAFMKALAGTDIVTGQDYGLMGHHGFTPTINDRIYDETGEVLLRTLSEVEPLAPNGETILYTLGFEV